VELFHDCIAPDGSKAPFDGGVEVTIFPAASII